MTPEQYQELRKVLSTCDPRLERSKLSEQPLALRTWTPWTKGRARVVALDVDATGSFNQPTEYTDARQFSAVLTAKATATSTCSRSVYLLEGLTSELVNVLGAHFQIHPSMFMDHELLVPHVEGPDRLTGESAGLPFLPSATYGREHFSFKYHEPLVLSKPPTRFSNVCDTSGRHFAITRVMGRFSAVGVCRRKCTFWSKADRQTGGWNCLVICDPPIRRLLARDYSEKSAIDVETSPYGSGYLDFVPLSRQLELRRGPPRTSMLEDLLFYLQNHACILDLSGPASVRALIERVIASHFLSLARYIQGNVGMVRAQLSRRNDLTSFAVATTEELWSDIQAWEQRVTEYQDDVEAAMLQLGIPFGTASDISRTKSFNDSTADFQHLRLQFQKIGQRVNALSNVITALASLAGNRAMSRNTELSLKEAEQATRQTQSLKGLTVLGVIFLPLSFSASLLSMSERYLPGRGMFWVYFGISFPLLGLVVFCYFLVELGYREGETRWRVKAVLTNIRDRLEQS
ncbi:hypothetical protein QBC43DRAFT_251981 [Cladorrhinum sp. PSN259]|nr:hypothetical protein QBC43DRAFT_251981 [Cladorrhinum sp. PSN259]